MILLSLIQSKDEKNNFTKPDEWIDMADEPNHQELCNREQAYFLKAIQENLDLTDHLTDALNSLKIAFACDESVKTGKIIHLPQQSGIGIFQFKWPKNPLLVLSALQGIQIKISNALRYHLYTQSPQIRITWKQPEWKWEFSVLEKGIELGMDYLDKIFSIFLRLPTLQTSIGTRIGLATSKKRE